MFFNKKRTKSQMSDLCYPDPHPLPAQQLLLEKGITKHGWMFKKTGRPSKINISPKSNYDKRFFVLFNGWVYYFKDDQASEPQKYFSLNGYSSRVHPAVEEKIRPFPHMFKLYHEYPNHRTYYFAPDTAQEMKDWISCFKNDIERFNYKAVPKQRGSKSLPETKRNYYPGNHNRPCSSFNAPGQSSNCDSAGNSVTSSQSVSTLGSAGSVSEALYDPVSPDLDNYHSDAFEQAEVDQRKDFPGSSPGHHSQQNTFTQFRLPGRSPVRLKPVPPSQSKKPRSQNAPIFLHPPTLPLRPHEVESDEDNRIYSTIDDEPEVSQYPLRQNIERLSSLPQVPPPLPPNQMDDEYELPNDHQKNIPISPSSAAKNFPLRPPKPPSMSPSPIIQESYFDVAIPQDVFTHEYDTPPEEYLVNDVVYDEKFVEPSYKPSIQTNLHVNQPFHKNFPNRFNEVKAKPILPHKPLPAKHKPVVPFNKPAGSTNMTLGVNAIENRPKTSNVQSNLKPSSINQLQSQSLNSEISSMINCLKKTSISVEPKPDNPSNKPSWCLPGASGENSNVKKQSNHEINSSRLNIPLKPPVKKKPVPSPKPPTALKPTVKPKPFR